MTMRGHFIDGREVKGSSGVGFESIDPSTEEPAGHYSSGSVEDIDLAVRSAARAQRGDWSRTTPAERGRLLHGLADLLLADKDSLSAMETTDVGKPLKEARGDIDGVVATFRYNAGAADKLEGASIPLGPAFVDFTILEPIGVTRPIADTPNRRRPLTWPPSIAHPRCSLATRSDNSARRPRRLPVPSRAARAARPGPAS